jgi:serine/threonine protein kinase
VPASELHALDEAAAFHIGGSKASVVPHWYGTKACKVMVKRYPLEREEQMKREFGIASLLRFPSLSRVLGWVTLGEGRLGIITEAYGKDLHAVLAKDRGAATLEWKAKWSCQVAAALRYLHGRAPPITHGDVHPSNVLLTSGGDAVLCDFDCSCIEGAHPRKFERLKRLPRFPETFHAVVDLKRVDWLMFGFFLLSLASSNGAWDWRDAPFADKGPKLSKAEEFYLVVGVSQQQYEAAGYFLAVGFEEVEPDVGDDAVVCAMRALLPLPFPTPLDALPPLPFSLYAPANSSDDER